MKIPNSLQQMTRTISGIKQGKYSDLGALKMQDLKMQDQMSGHENAEPENEGPSRNAAGLCT